MSKEKIIGIVFATLGAIYTIVSIYDSYYQRKLIDNPNWVIEVDFNKSNYLIDEFKISSKNTNVNIQNFEIFLKGRDKLETFKSEGNYLFTETIKKNVINFLNQYFNINNDLYPFQYQSWSIPIVIKVRFEYLGELKEESRVYKYSFRSYRDKDNNIRLKSDNINFIKRVLSDKYLERDLIFEIKNCCFDLELTERDLYLELLEVDNSLSIFYDFLKMNYLNTWIEEIESTDTLDSIIYKDIKFYNFGFVSDTLNYKKWNEMVLNFSKNKLRYNFSINSNLDSILALFDLYQSGKFEKNTLMWIQLAIVKMK